MLSPRIIPCLLVSNKGLVKTKNFKPYKIYSKVLSNGEEYSYSKTKSEPCDLNIVLLHGNFSASINMEVIMNELKHEA